MDLSNVAVLLLLFVVSRSLRETESTSSHTDHKSRQIRQPHIVVIIADDLGWNDVSFHGADQIPTPNIDALAVHGVILNRHYVQPTCTPSRTAFLTGRYPIRAGLQGYLPLKAGEPRGIPLGTTLLPEHLKNLGYTTRLLGKWHVGYYTRDHTPTRRGFDSFYGYYNGYVKYFDHTIKQDNQTGYDLHRDSPTKSSVEYTREYFTEAVTREAVDVISKHNSQTPLFLEVAHLAPHSGEDDELLEVPDMAEVNATFGYIPDINRRKYAGMMQRLDQSVGEIVEALRKANMLQNSIILFTADNGAQTEGLHENYGSNVPLRGLKFSLFDGGVRAAACIYSPLILRKTRVSNELIHITDWLPTFYSAAGGKVSDLGVTDGFDQWHSIVTGTNSPRESALLNIEDHYNIEGAVSGNYKLIRGRQWEYTDFYGDTGRGSPNPAYDTSAVRNSRTARAIRSATGRSVTAREIIALRKAAEITCAPHVSYDACTEKCLFDMVRDPCETTDVSAEYPEVLQRLDAYIKSFYSSIVPQPFTEVQPAGYPCHFNGVWQPWLESNYSSNRNEIA